MTGNYVSFFPNIATTGRENAAHWLPVPTFRVLTSFHEARGYTFRPFLTPKFVVRIPFLRVFFLHGFPEVRPRDVK